MTRLRTVVCLVCALMLAVGNYAVAQQAQSQDTAKNSVVRVYIEDDVIFGLEGSSDILSMTLPLAGSAVAIGDSADGVTYFLTNRHVVEGVDLEYFAEYYAQQGNTDAVVNGFLNDDVADRVFVLTGDMGNRVSAAVVSVSERTDLAVLKISEPITNRQPIKVRTFNELGSENIYAIGFPIIADRLDTSGVELRSTLDDMSVTQGIVNRVLGNEQTRSGEMIQIDAEINGGNSGGALVDSQGYLLGINTKGYSDGQVNYAVSSNEVVRFLEDERISFLLAQDEVSTPQTTELEAEPTTQAVESEPVAQQSNPYVLYIVIAVVVIVLAVAVALWKSRQSAKPQNGKESAQATAESAQSRSLVAESGALKGKKFKLDRKVVVGRDNSKCQIVFPKDTPKVSAVHCTIRFDGKTVTVEDNNSTCGTFIDGKQIPSGQPVVLHRGHKLSIGSNSQTFTLHS